MAFTQQGGFVHRFGSQGKSPGMFSGGVQGIRVQGGRVYATDVGRLPAAGIRRGPSCCRCRAAPARSRMSSAAPAATAPSQMSAPRGIAVDPTDPSTVYVASTNGNFITRWHLNLGAPGSFNGGAPPPRSSPAATASPWPSRGASPTRTAGTTSATSRTTASCAGIPAPAGTCQTVVQGLTSTRPPGSTSRHGRLQLRRVRRRPIGGRAPHVHQRQQPPHLRLHDHRLTAAAADGCGACSGSPAGLAHQDATDPVYTAKPLA